MHIDVGAAVKLAGLLNTAGHFSRRALSRLR